jgi:hypothetical protein
VTLYEHALSVYNELQNRAGEPDKHGKMRFEGSKVEAYRAVGVSQAYYSQIFDSLTELGCIEQVRRGASGHPSVIVLHYPPDPGAFAEVYRAVLTKPHPLDTIREELDELRRRLPDIDINSFIISLDARLTEYEGRLARLEQGR